MSKKLLIICGPTATGKTALGIGLAKRFRGEIVSADSRQVYRGMDIGTGKDLPVDSKFKTQNAKLKLEVQKYQVGYYLFSGIPVWLYDVVPPDYRFSVADYLRCARVLIKDIWQRGKLPIIVGGTGFYIKGLIDGIETLGVPPDWEIREKWQAGNVAKLQSILEKVAPARLQVMNESDRQNPRRLIRAIEIATKGRRARGPGDLKFPIEDVLFIGLTAPNKILYQRIDKRVGERVKQGIEKEIRELLELGYDWDSSALGTTLGYQEWRPYMEGQKSPLRQPTPPPLRPPGFAGRAPGKSQKLRNKPIQRWQYNEHAYARHQLTWFKKDKRINWFDLTRSDFKDRVEKLVNSWYTQVDAPKS